MFYRTITNAAVEVSLQRSSRWMLCQSGVILQSIHYLLLGEIEVGRVQTVVYKKKSVDAFGLHKGADT